MPRAVIDMVAAHREAAAVRKQAEALRERVVESTAQFAAAKALQSAVMAFGRGGVPLGLLDPDDVTSIQVVGAGSQPALDPHGPKVFLVYDNAGNPVGVAEVSQLQTVSGLAPASAPAPAGPEPTVVVSNAGTMPGAITAAGTRLPKPPRATPDPNKRPERT